MFVPPFAVLNQTLDRATIKPDVSDSVTLPAGLYRFLVSCLLVISEFDEAQYLEAYPDVAEQIADGTFASAFAHFVMKGYFDGYVDGCVSFDEDWYLTHYPDVAEAVKDGKFLSGASHYSLVGAFEWRAPNANAADDLVVWRKAIL